MVKLIFIISTILSNYLYSKPIIVWNESALKQAVVDLAPGESFWLIAYLEDSFENETISQIAQGGRYLELEGWGPLSFEKYRQIILDAGCKISQGVVERSLTVGSMEEWAGLYLAPKLGLGPVEQKLFAREFALKHPHPEGIHRQWRVKVSATR